MSPFAKPDRSSSASLAFALRRAVIPGEDVYAAFGQTLGGRYLSVFFIYKPVRKTAVIISARDMTDKERRAYARK
jgi:uncharacterized DUF497 family protein